MSETFVLDTISQAHQLVGLPAPKHPLVSVVYTRDLNPTINLQNVKLEKLAV